MFARKPLALMVALVSLSLAGPALASFLVTGPVQSSVDQLAKNPIDPSLIQTLSQTTDSVTALFELGGAPVVAHQRAQTSSPERVDRSQLLSAAAIDYEASLAGEQHAFEAAAAAVSPDLQVNAELRKLVNAVSVTAPGFEIARIAGLPGVAKSQLSRQYHALLNQSVPL